MNGRGPSQPLVARGTDKRLPMTLTGCFSLAETRRRQFGEPDLGSRAVLDRSFWITSNRCPNGGVMARTGRDW